MTVEKPTTGVDSSESSTKSGSIRTGGGFKNRPYQHRGQKRSHYKRDLCESWQETGSCADGGKCRSAHGVEDIRAPRPPPPKGMRPMCINYHVKKSCPNGANCYYVHEEPLDRVGGEGSSPSKRVRNPQALAELFHNTLLLDNDFGKGQKQVEALRPTLSSTACVFVLLKGDRRPAIVLKESLQEMPGMPDSRDGRAAKVKELACLQLCIEDLDSVQLMAEEDESQVKATDDLVHFVDGSRARTYFLLPSRLD